MEKIDSNELLLKIYTGQQKMQEQLNTIQLEELPEIKDQIKEITQKEIPEIKEELRRISGSVARIEVEHGEKLQILFDAFKTHAEKFESQEKRINICEKQIAKHGDEIYYLKSVAQGA